MAKKEAGPIKAERHVIETEKVDGKIVFAVMGDSHGDMEILHEFGEYLKESPDSFDAVLCPGDLLDECQDTEPVVEWCSGVNMPIYKAIGNHEHRLGEHRLKIAYDKLRSLPNVVLLEEDFVPATLAGTNVRISALNMPLYYYEYYKENKAFFEYYANMVYENTLDSSNYHINISHPPGYIVRGHISGSIKAVQDIDMFLFGHMHSGIVRLPNHRGLLGPYATVFPEDAYGRYSENGKEAIITGGLTPFAKSIEVSPLVVLNKVLPHRIDIIELNRKR